MRVRLDGAPAFLKLFARVAPLAEQLFEDSQACWTSG